MKPRNILLTFVLLTLGSASLWASSSYGRDGQFKADSFTVKVHWADIYNVRPKPGHWIRSHVKIIPGPQLQQPGHCTLKSGGKTLKMIAGKLEFKGTHISRFTLFCNFKSSVNKHMHTIQREFTVKQLPGKDGSPFTGTLKVMPVK